MRAVLFINGEVAQPQSLRNIFEIGDTLVSVDGGMRHLKALDLLPQIVIGDMDSIDAESLSALEQGGTEILRYPAEKDQTDFELALDILAERGFNEILVIGALGGRVDQALANIWLLAERSQPGFSISFDDGCEQVFLIQNKLTLKGQKGDQVSLIPYQSPVQGITTEGLEYPLNNETLFPEKTRGLSNVLIGEQAQISIKSGRLLCIHRSESAC